MDTIDLNIIHVSKPIESFRSSHEGPNKINDAFWREVYQRTILKTLQRNDKVDNAKKKKK